MGRLFHIWYGLFLIGGWALLSIGRVNEGGVLIMSFQGDALHMAQAVLRVASGEVPHRDFQTPLGVMAFLPISGLINLGFGVGKAFAYAPSLLGIICLPAVYWLGFTRFKPAGALLFGTIFLALMFAYIHGGGLPSVTASMYYNNWCWAIAMLIVLAAVLQGPQGRFTFWFEALILGFGMGFLTLTKATYAVFLLPAIVLALGVDKSWGKLLASVAFSLLFLVFFTLPIGGVSYWFGYINDLLSVAKSQTRSQPSLGLAELAVSARHLPGTLALLAAVVFFRQAKHKKEGLVLLVLGGGWLLIVFQNWENDPHWMAFVGLLLFPMSNRIEIYNSLGWPLRRAVHLVAVGLIFMGVPLTYTQLQSVALHDGLNPVDFPNTLPINRQMDLRFRDPKQGVVWAKTPFDALAGQSQGGKVSRLGDEVLPDCRKENGLYADLQATGVLLDEIGETAGKTVLYTDWVNSLWMFSKLEPLPGGAPWYYGGTPGFQNADYLVVPLCPMGPSVRRTMLDQIAADPTLEFVEVQRNDLFVLLKKK
ncbi:MAG: hypothetical protein KUG74_07890 [Rhodobacteraceae bacterium]|nr:hypothetical protein [Paracoccaceae bacterium]